MEAGVLTGSTGRRVSFRNAIVVMTSNLGGEQRSDGLGFQPEGREGQTKECLRRHFSPEFLGRLDAVVSFNTLQQDTIEKIAEKYLRQLQERVSGIGMQLVLPQELPAELARKSKKEGGARQIRRQVQEQVEGPLAVYLLDCAKKPARIKGKLEEGKLIFQA